MTMESRAAPPQAARLHHADHAHMHHSGARVCALGHKADTLTPPRGHRMDDLLSLIREMGGGLAAVVIAVSGAANWIQYRRNNELQDKMHDMMLSLGKENRDLLTVTNSAISQNTSAINQNATVMREALDRLGRHS